MGIGAVGNECIRIFHHLRRHVGMKIEADDQRQLLADHLAHARENFALAVVEMFGDHRAVQIEIDGVDRAGGLDAIDDHFGDAFIGILCDVRRRACGAPDGRHQLPAFRLRRRHETCHADIDVAHFLEQLRAHRHRRPSTTLHKRVIGRLGRREGVGLVQEAADGDAGHYRSRLIVRGRDVRLAIARSASDEAIHSRMAASCFWIALSAPHGEEAHLRRLEP